MNLKSLIPSGAALAALLLPFSASAQADRYPIDGTNLASLFMSAVDFINVIVIPFVWAIAFIVFVWGIFQYFIAGGANEEQRDKGKQLAVWGIIAFAVMSSVWGLINLVTNSLYLNEAQPEYPTFEIKE